MYTILTNKFVQYKDIVIPGKLVSDHHVTCSIKLNESICGRDNSVSIARPSGGLVGVGKCTEFANE